MLTFFTTDAHRFSQITKKRNQVWRKDVVHTVALREKVVAVSKFCQMEIK